MPAGWARKYGHFRWPASFDDRAGVAVYVFRAEKSHIAPDNLKRARRQRGCAAPGERNGFGHMWVCSLC
jgi:hypothetical protein